MGPPLPTRMGRARGAPQAKTRPWKRRRVAAAYDLAWWFRCTCCACSWARTARTATRWASSSTGRRSGPLAAKRWPRTWASARPYSWTTPPPARVLTPVELPFAGHPCVGASWLLDRERDAVPAAPGGRGADAGRGRYGHRGTPEWGPGLRVDRARQRGEVDALTERRAVTTWPRSTPKWTHRNVQARVFPPAARHRRGRGHRGRGHQARRPTRHPRVTIHQGLSVIEVRPLEDGLVEIGGGAWRSTSGASTPAEVCGSPGRSVIRVSPWTFNGRSGFLPHLLSSLPPRRSDRRARDVVFYNEAAGQVLGGFEESGPMTRGVGGVGPSTTTDGE